jgi:hypothetical protein
MKHAPSQQGRTPSGQGQQGRTPSQLAVATPPVSTPFSNAAQAAFSPRGQRSSPQQYKKSPATSGLMGQSSMASFNFDSPSTAAAMGALGIGSGFDMSLEGVGGLDTLSAAFASEDEKLRRLETILKILNVSRVFLFWLMSLQKLTILFFFFSSRRRRAWLAKKAWNDSPNAWAWNYSPKNMALPAAERQRRWL